MNLFRMLAASAITGTVIVAGEVALNGVVLDSEWSAVNAALGLAPPTTLTSALVLLKLFGLGFVVVWLYWAIRPRFGPGAGTALIAGGFIAFIIWGWVLAGLYMGGYVNESIALITVFWGAVELPLAAWLGVTYLERDAGTA